MRLRFILVEPKVPENIGAAARAIKVNGFDELVLVNPLCPLDGKALWVAHGSDELVRNARKFDNLREALDGSVFSVATSAKARNVFCEPVVSGDLLTFLSSRINKGDTVSIVFGREESGLTNDEIKLCDISTFIPMKNPYPSINLAQAVMVYAYLLSGIASSPGKLSNDESEEDGKNTTLHLLKEKAGNILTSIGIHEDDSRYGRIMERLSYLSPSDIKLMMSVASKLDPTKPC
jgi:tRNA/rRNA methyltransferase